MLDLLIKNVYINGHKMDIAIDKGIIVKIDESIEDNGREYLDAHGSVAIPGFIDCHLHLDKALLNERQPYQDLSGPEKGGLTRLEKEKFTLEDIVTRAERVILHGIKSGNLAIRTNVDVDPIVGLKGIEALLILKEKYKDIIDIQVVAFSQEGMERYPETEGLLRKAIEMGADHVGGHTIVDSNGKGHIDTILQIAKDFDIEADFHLDESGNPQHYLLPYVAEKMMEMELQGRVNGIHCCTLSSIGEERKRAIELMKESKMKVTIAPTAISTRNLAPTKELLKEGILLGLGSDNVRDFFNPLGSGDIKQAALLLAYVHRYFTDEDIDALWDMITCKGAELIGFKDYGIEEGKKANITLFKTNTHKEILAQQMQPYYIIRNGVIYMREV